MALGIQDCRVLFSVTERRRRRRQRRLANAICLSALLLGIHAKDTPAVAGDSILRALEFGGSVEVAYERQQNFDIDRAAPDDVDLLPVELQLELLFEPSDYVEIYLQSQLARQFVLREEGEDEDRKTEFLLEEAYVSVKHPDLGLSLQVGRQSFEDDRQWLYDAELDAVRAAYRGSGLALEVSASRRALVNEDLLNTVDSEPVNNFILYGAYDPSEDITLGAYGILSDHRDRDARPAYLGLYSFGRIADRLTYWLDAAHMLGREEGMSLRGYGLDALGVYHFDAPLSPYVILGYAFGSGDADRADDRDGTFRQTGLQGNEAEVGGFVPLSYYGEAFDPELSNMSIFTAGLGLRPSREVSIDLLYHYYLQDEASDELGDSAFDADPTGRSRRLGSEVDLVLGFQAFEDFEIRGYLGYFMPGRAFDGARDDALYARIEMQFEF